MASFTLTDASRFPPGTEVSAYAAAPGQDTWDSRRFAGGKSVRTQPPGPPVGTQTVGPDGATFHGLESGRLHFLAAEIGGEWVIVGVRA